MTKDNRIYLRVTEEEKEVLKRCSKEQDLSLSDFFRNCVKQTLQEIEKENKIKCLKGEGNGKPAGYISR